MKIAFDIGGVLGKYPDIFVPMVLALQCGGVEVFVITDMHEHSAASNVLKNYGYCISDEMIVCADYLQYGERCKAACIKEYEIDLLIDDHPGYCVDSGCVSLFVWPNPYIEYTAKCR